MAIELNPGPRLSASRIALVLLAMVLGVVAGTSADLVYLATRRPGSSASVSSATSQTGAGSSSSSASSSTLDAAAIAAVVDPAVVDINTTLADGSGSAAGTGVVITSSGEILTNNHVIQGASSIRVQVAGTGATYTATVVGTDRADDIALLRLQGASNLKIISVGDSSKVAAGDAVVAIGNALGQGGTPAVSQGVIAGLNQTITADDGSGNAETLTGLLQVQALIQPGDSGGPLVDTSGKVIGIDTAAQVSGRFRQAANSTNGYAIPINAAISIARQIESGGGGNSNIQVGDRAILGVVAQDGSATGATIVGVQGGSPAAVAGLTAGDVITSLGGKGVTSTSSLSAAMHGYKPGDRVAVGWVDAAGRGHSATIQLTTGPPA